MSDERDIGDLLGGEIPGPPGYTYGSVESGNGDKKRVRIFYNDEDTGEVAEGVTVEEVEQDARLLVERHARSLEDD